MKSLIHIVFTITLLYYYSASCFDIHGSWSGAVIIGTNELKIKVKFFSKDDSLLGTIDIPQQSVAGWRLSNLFSNDTIINFELDIALGNTPRFDGKIYGDSISGKFTQKTFTSTFYLNRTNEDSVVKAELPYSEEEVEFYNGDIVLAGTLTIPKNNKKFPAVVLISGSGAQNRDEEVFGFKIFGNIADYLSSNGIAVLRYDDRGIGGSNGKIETSTTEDFAHDALSGVNFLRSRKGIGIDKIGLLGHSEGGIAASIAASLDSKMDFIILMSSPSLKGEAIILAQIEAIMKANGKNKDQIIRTLNLQKDIFTALKTGKGLDSMASIIADIRTEDYYEQNDTIKKNPEIEKNIRLGVDNELKVMMTPWYKFFLDYDPMSSLTKVRCPILALFGELDSQVPVGLNKQALSNAITEMVNKNLTIKVIPKANHLYQEAETGSPMEYKTLKQEFVAGFQDIIKDWILSR